jgi:2,4-dienoyl-CoA reductase-like NADH-dependent reductase (Old Yellow Enzyme family)
MGGGRRRILFSPNHPRRSLTSDIPLPTSSKFTGIHSAPEAVYWHLMPNLFSSLKLRDVELSNRIVVSPMCQYSSNGGHPSDWHFVHLGSRAVGGAGLVFVEATAVVPEGRISRFDMGIWDDSHIDSLARLAKFVQEQGSAAGIQLAHAGRRGSCLRTWEGGGSLQESEGGWRVVAPSAMAFSDGYSVPQALTEGGIQDTVRAFAEAAHRAWEAGFRVLEIHAAHGYLIHQFLSPFSNRRADRYGGSFENRTRLAREVVAAVRGAWPESFPLFLRVSATEWAEGGWDIDQTVELARQVAKQGVDLIDCSSGGNVANAKIPVGPGYQARFAEQVRREAGIATAAVGMITSPIQADHIIRSGQADVVLLAREMLRDPYWPMRAARELGYQIPWPAQYLRAARDGTPARRPARTLNLLDRSKQAVWK